MPQKLSFSLARRLPGQAGFALATGLLSLCTGMAAADAADLTQLPLEQLMALEVTTASKFPQLLREAPSAVTVILRGVVPVT